MKTPLRKKPCPQAKANFFSLITFSWMNELMWNGFKRPLVAEDIWELEEDNSASNIVKICEIEWTKELERWTERKKTEEDGIKMAGKYPFVGNCCRKEYEDNSKETTTKNFRHKQQQQQPSLTRMFLRVVGPYYLVGCLFKIAEDILTFCSPIFLRKLIEFVKTKNEDIVWGYIYAVTLFVSMTMQSICLHQSLQRTFVASMRVRTAVMALVYRKMLTTKETKQNSFTDERIVNMMSIDAQKCHSFLTCVAWFWSAPLKITIALVFLYNLMGWSVLVGLIVLGFLLPLNIHFTNKEKQIHARQMKHKDNRSKLIYQMLSGIKLLKLYGWEETFAKKITDCRKEESMELQQSRFLHALAYAINHFAPVLVSIVTFATYVLVAGEDLTAEKIFVAISLFNIVKSSIVLLPNISRVYIQYKISVTRIKQFLMAEDLLKDDILRLSYKKEGKRAFAVNMENCTFSWGELLLLRNIILKIPQGSLTAIVGQVGTGKSLLLSAILGEIQKVSGEITTCGKIAYASQQAWIQNKTLRENILFTKKFHKYKYQKIIHACALKADLDMLPVGDMTEIGERGINLSGGQKQRVSLARAVYNNGDVYLLDDPLSAVDAHVGKHIFDSVIGPNGLLKNKTRILVTHNLSFLPQVDLIVVLKNNTVFEIGTYKELLTGGNDFGDFLKTHHIQSKDRDLNNNIPNSKEGRLDIQIVENRRFLEEKNKRSKTGMIYEKEKSETGPADRKIFLYYIKSMGTGIMALILLLGVLQESLLLTNKFWLVNWSSNVNITSSSNRIKWIAVYASIGLMHAVMLLCLFGCVVMGTTNASQRLHASFLSTLLRCPMSFFETTPMGRIVNRFVKDMSTIDEAIPKSFEPFVTNLMVIFGTVLVISYSTPIFLLVLAPLSIFYLVTQRYYVSSSRQLKRIESVHRSHIYNHYLESMAGASTIRAFNQTERFIEENEYRIDKSQGARFASVSANRWLAMRLEFCGNLVTFFAALFSIVNYENMTPGIAGLSISYALQITKSLNWLVRMTSELETNIISVERIKNYIDMPKEAPAKMSGNGPDENWPEHGVVTFKSYSVRYRPGLNLVLKNISFSVKPAEKIGVVGRTGAGKSSMVLALFRIIESASGKILIDGVDIAGIGLKDLRKKLSIIPQDPILFTSSLRFNLDPFNEFNDDQIWRSLEVSHLKTFVMSLPGGLQYEVLKGGENFSVGQRQLICLARALLRSSKILVMDEATAAVDMKTDAYIQEAIRNEFNGCTVFTIAHRLKSVMDYDRIMVLDKGHIVEFDTPDALLCHKSYFYRMAKDAGLTNGFDKKNE